jgi:hypothetical protein
MHRRALKTLLATVLCLGCFAAPALAQLSISINISDEPPAPRYEPVRSPRSGWVWVPGIWFWDAGRYHWSEGHWIKARPGQRWVPARWEHRGDHYRFESGGWEPVRWDPPRHDARYDRDERRDDRHDNGHGNAWGRKGNDGRDHDDDRRDHDDDRGPHGHR